MACRWFSRPALTAAFQSASRELSAEWHGVSGAQLRFLLDHYARREQSLALVTEGELETAFHLRGGGFEVRATCTASARWLKPGKSVQWPRCAGYRGQRVFASEAHDSTGGLDLKISVPMVRMSPSQTLESPGLLHPAFQLATENKQLEENVYVMPLFEPPSDTLGLWSLAEALARILTPSTQGFDHLFFPMINVDEEEAVPWAEGMFCGDLPVLAARQGLVLKVNHLGFYEESRFSMQLSASSGNAPPPRAYFVNMPFLYWRTRMKELQFVAWIDSTGFGRPEIDFVDPPANAS